VLGVMASPKGRAPEPEDAATQRPA
jgi:hypothetical protein